MLEIDLGDGKFAYPFNKLIPPRELSNEKYHSLAGISSSGLKDARTDPKLYFMRDKLMSMPSPALELGSAVHKGLLEPETYNEDKFDLTPLGAQKARIMINNGKVMFDKYLRDTLNEYSLFVRDDGLIRRVRMDAYDKANGIIYDVKTSKCTDKFSFKDEAYRLNYHLQAAFYTDTLKLAGFKADFFVFFVIPNESPCKPFAFYATQRFIEDGRAAYTEVLENIKAYKGGEDVLFNELDLPRWRIEQLDETA
ncbi:PD-(D/E)XK nuclease-like domain-containing protein [Campylobacter showae]|uniref:PD-(D/E)XK nuclease-like domain-containing protein n=1 Tax=Campylobacter showae TaxID=204 RepID=UPI0028D2FC9A|nr:PD-(D/E)XK nuclease-like domain-containing protein [Campylobacter showae]